MLSIVILHRQNDTDNLKICLSTLPSWAEVIIVETIPMEKKYPDSIHNVSKQVTMKGILRRAAYHYEKDNLDFAHARNSAAHLTTKPFIMALDDDERLCVHQHNNLKQTLKIILEKPDVGGLWNRNVSWIPSFDEGDGIGKEVVVKQCRIYRNDPRVKFEGALHESVEYSMIEAGLRIVDSGFMIIHEGYIGTVDEMMEKQLRNFKTMWKHPELLDEKYKNYYLKKMLGTAKIINDLVIKQ